MKVLIIEDDKVLSNTIANIIVKLHKGSIKALHNKPKGTVFLVKLPK